MILSIVDSDSVNLGVSMGSENMNYICEEINLKSMILIIIKNLLPFFYILRESNNILDMIRK